MHMIGIAEKSCASNHAWSRLTAMPPIYRIHVDGRGHGRLFKIIKNTRCLCLALGARRCVAVRKSGCLQVSSDVN